MMKVGKNGTRSAGSTRDRRQSLPAGLSQVNLNAAGIDVGASSHFVAVPEDRWEPPVREFHAYTADLYRLRTGWPSAALRQWPWNPLECTGYPCSEFLRSGDLR